MKRPDWDKIVKFFGSAMQFLPHRADSKPISSISSLNEFIETRAAHVAQTSLYGYLKNRMGTRYPEHFQDDAFVVSINQAKWRVYAACLSDLTIFSTGYCLDGSKEDAEGLARHLFAQALNNSFTDDDAVEARPDAEAAFNTRLGFVDWSLAGKGETAFSQSPIDLVKWAPVTEEFKQQDSEIVMNSIRFRWREVREQLRKRAVPVAIKEEWQAGVGSGQRPASEA